MSRTATDGFATLAVEEATPLVGDNRHVFIDVREPNEVETSGKVPGALTIPLGALGAALDPASTARPEGLGPDTPVVFYCAAGGRSRKASELALAQGYKDVSHIAGGFGAWRNAGGESEPV